MRSAVLPWVMLFGLASACDAPALVLDGSTADAAMRCASDVECSDAIYCNGIEACAPSLPGADARGCVSRPPPCAAESACVEAMRTCTDECPDADGDGHTSTACGGDDCDDEDASRSPGNVEVCDDVDDDCDPTTFGDRDEDGDGAVDAACCNGDRCGLDCDDARAGVSPSVPEVCNGIDDDCDARVDEGFECAADDVITARECRTSCGSLGTQTCTSSCVWSACRTEDEGPAFADTCNRCDDDGDGVLDDGFPCMQGELLTCEDQCGASGIGFCSASCELPRAMPEECTAPTETCNYCDDDGDGSFEDDRGLVEPEPVVWSVGSCDGVTLGADTTCGTTTFPGRYEGPGVRLADGTASGTWQAWMATPVSMGWGELKADVTVFGTAPDAVETPTGGFAIVLASAPCGSGPTNEVGVPMDCIGIAAEWHFGDRPLMIVRRLDGSASGEILGTPADVPGLAPGAMQTPMRLRVGYTPDLPSTGANENLVRVERLDLHGAGEEIFTRDTAFGIGSTPRNELPVGSPIHVGVVAATGAVPTTIEWLLSAVLTFDSLDPMSVTASGACAP